MQETAAQSAQAFTVKAIAFYVKYSQSVSETGAAYYKAQAEKYERFAQAASDRAQQEAPVVMESTATIVQPAKRVRCPHYPAIKAFMAVACANGLDTQAKDRCRGAVGVLLGRRIESRADLTGAEWGAMGAAIRSGKLVW